MKFKKAKETELTFYGHKGLCPDCGGIVKVPMQNATLDFDNCFCFFCGGVFKMVNQPENHMAWMDSQYKEKNNLFNNDERHPWQDSFDKATKKAMGI